MQEKVLIHTAFFAEAKPLVEYFKLRCTQTKPYKIYEDDNILLMISGMGKENTLHVKDILIKHNIAKAINIGIAGCKDKNIEIGTLCCTNHNIESIRYESLTTVAQPLDNSKDLKTTLVDMEADAFLFICKEFLNESNIFILKVVSDYLDTTIPKKDFVWKIIKQNLNNIEKIVILKN